MSSAMLCGRGSTLGIVVADCKDTKRSFIEQLVADARSCCVWEQYEVFLYTKCSGTSSLGERNMTQQWRSRHHLQHTTLPNIGFEAHTYLRHIVNHYDRLHSRTIFVQGNSWEHAPHLKRSEAPCALQRRMQQQHFVSYTSELVGHGLNSSTSSCGDGSQYWQEDGSARSWCRIDALNRFLQALATSQDPDGGVGGTSSWHHGGGASTTLWPLPLCFHATQSAIFSVSSERIRRWPKWFFEQALRSLTPRYLYAEPPQGERATPALAMSALKRYERLCEGSLGGKKSALAWEASWHVLFGADPCLCKRADVAPHAVAVKYGARAMREADDAWLGHCSAGLQRLRVFGEAVYEKLANPN